MKHGHNVYSYMLLGYSTVSMPLSVFDASIIQHCSKLSH